MNYESLPANARRWLDHVLPADAAIPAQVTNTQEGEMDIRGRWTPFTATTIYRANPFTFTWKARFSLLPGVWLIAEDGHDPGSGWGGAKLWGVIPMGGRRDPEVFTMQVVRNLAELPWKPQLALALPGLTWQDAGDWQFAVTAAAAGQEISVRFELNEQGEIVRAAGRRHYDVPGGFVEVPWHYAFSDYRDYEGVRMPSYAVATYEKDEGSWEYWRGRIASVASGS